MYRGDVAKSVQIRNVPDDVHATLRTRAAAAGLSLSDYLLSEITEVAERTSTAEVLARANRRPGGLTDRRLLAEVMDEIRQRDR